MPVSPGPRFFIPCLPFLALGFAPAFERRLYLTSGLAVLSIAAMTATTLTWTRLHLNYYWMWGEFWLLASRSHDSIFYSEVENNVLHSQIGMLPSAFLMVFTVAAATAIGLGSLRNARRS